MPTAVASVARCPSVRGETGGCALQRIVLRQACLTSDPLLAWWHPDTMTSQEPTQNILAIGQGTLRLPSRIIQTITNPFDQEFMLMTVAFATGLHA